MNATCCEHEQVFSDDLTHCPVKSCSDVIEPVLHQAVKVVGGLGLFFSFTEVCVIQVSFVNSEYFVWSQKVKHMDRLQSATVRQSTFSLFIHVRRYIFQS